METIAYLTSSVRNGTKVTYWMPLPEPPEAEAALQKGDTHEANPV